MPKTGRRKVILMSIVEEIIDLVSEVLQLGDRAREMNEGTRLLGAVAEFDSMAVVSIITALEERYGITVEDDEIDAATFESVGTLSRFLEEKIAE